MKTKFNTLTFIVLLLFVNELSAQEAVTKFSGELLSDQRWFTQDTPSWAWSENRLNLKFEQRLPGQTRFRTEVWLRNFGLPMLQSPLQLYSKTQTDPWDLEIREAWMQKQGFLDEKIDLTIGRQRIAWGTADKINPTDNLNPLDFEDVLDFGRRRGIDAISLNYYPSRSFDLQFVFLPWFRPANLPVGPFASLFAPQKPLPDGLTVTYMKQNLRMPKPRFQDQAALGLRAKGRVAGLDLSVSYSNAYDGLPYLDTSRVLPHESGGVAVISNLRFNRLHTFGADLATSLGGAGLWAEAALTLPAKNHISTVDLSAVSPFFPGLPAFADSLELDTNKPWLKWVLGTDYHFKDGTYFNLQYAHGFYHERGRDNLNNYLTIRLERSFINDRLNVSPLSGAFVFKDAKDIQNQHAIVWMPELAYKPVPDFQIGLKATLFGGKGENLFARMNNYDMLTLKASYSF
ncbi:MAG: hypothetical protein IPM52_04600 [Bacteroidetes bacterium]|nr:hypothetical protein [Bacteroidota bacterium]